MNDNVETPSLWSGPDPHGQAAMLLIESLLHGLIERRLLTPGEAVTIIENASDVQLEIAPDRGGSSDPLPKSLTLLHAVAASLRLDTLKDPESPALGMPIRE